jgi:gliding motility-associated-like protein
MKDVLHFVMIRKYTFLSFILLLSSSSYLKAQTYTVENTQTYNQWMDWNNCDYFSWGADAPNGSFALGLFKAYRGEIDRIEFSSTLANQTITNPTGPGFNNLCANDVTIDGSGAPGLKIVFTGEAFFNINGSRNTVTNINIEKQGNQHAVFVRGSGNTFENSTINRTAKADYMALYMIGVGATLNTIQNNVITGPSKSAIEIRGGASNNTIKGNDISGFFNIGIALSVGVVDGTIIDGNAIHGGMHVTGVENFYPTGIISFEATHTNTTIINNIIGSDFTRAPNVEGIYGNGISVLGGTATIGTPGNGNHIVNTGNAQLTGLLNDNRGRGIYIESGTVVVQSNVIGVDWDTKKIISGYGNDMSGVFVKRFEIAPGIFKSAPIVTIGGTGTGEGNIIGGNGYGHDGINGDKVAIPRSGVMFENYIGTSTVVGNFIGVNENGDAIGNRQEAVTLFTANGVVVTGNKLAYSGANGVAARVDSENNRIENNEIFGNGGSGVTIEGSNSNLISENEIYSNAGQGVELFYDYRRVVSASENTIIGNLIGNTDGSSAAKENGVHGIAVRDKGQRNIIGTRTNGNIIRNKQNGNAIFIDGSSTNRNMIRGNSTSGNKFIAIELSNSGNNEYGAGNRVTFNSGETRIDTISGRAPAVGDTIDIYTSIDGTCQTVGSGVPQGATWVGYTIAFEDLKYSSDYAGAVWVVNYTTFSGLTFENAVVTATQKNGIDNLNTSEFASCLEDLSCTPPEPVTIIDPGFDDFCENTDVPLGVTLQEGFNYTWYNGTTIVSGPTLNGNVFDVSLTGDYKVIIEDLVEPADCNATSAVVSLTKRDNPILDGEIVGFSPVCKGFSTYELNGQTANYDLIQWVNPLNNGATYINGVNTGTSVDVDFSNVLDVSVTVDLSVMLSKNYPKGVVCTNVADVADVFNVTVTENPVLSFVDALPEFACKTTGNIVSINDYDPSYEYLVVSNTGTGTGLTVTTPVKGAVDGDILVDVADGAKGGTITISKTSDVGCSVEESFSVTVIGCGRTLGMTSPNDICGDASLTFTSISVAGDNENIINYQWSFVTTGTASIEGQDSFEGLEYKSVTINTSGDGTITPSLFVTFDSDPLVPLEVTVGVKTVAINPNPILSLAVRSGLDNNCKDQVVIYEVTPLDNTNYDYTWSGATNYLDGGLPTDSAISVNGDGSYTVTVTAVDKFSKCTTVHENYRVVNATPVLGNVIAPLDSFFCDLNSYDSLYTYNVQGENIVSYVWEMLDFQGNVITDFPFQSAQNKNSIDVVFPERGQYVVRVIGTGDPSLCVFKDTSYIAHNPTIDIEQSFLVEHQIVSSKDLYCESDTGSFYVIQQIKNDPSGLFGSQSHHYSKFTWDYNRDTTKQDNFWIDTLIGVLGDETFYTAFYGADTTYVMYDEALDSTNSNSYGPFAFGDEVAFGAEPQFCYHYESILVDTVSLDTLLQVRPEIKMTIEGDEDIHVITDVVIIPQIEINDINNLNGDLSYQYAISWIDKDGFSSIEGIEAFAPAVFGKSVAMPPVGYDTVTYVMALNAGACVVYDTTLLVMDFGIFIPTVFTPNADGEYDLWEIQNIDKFEGASVQVFNRWGSLLFESTDYPNNKFDGTYNGEALPVASYYYIVDLKNGAKLFSGAVSVIR